MGWPFYDLDVPSDDYMSLDDIPDEYPYAKTQRLLRGKSSGTQTSRITTKSTQNHKQVTKMRQRYLGCIRKTDMDDAVERAGRALANALRQRGDRGLGGFGIIEETYTWTTARGEVLTLQEMEDSHIVAVLGILQGRRELVNRLLDEYHKRDVDNIRRRMEFLEFQIDCFVYELNGREIEE